jgi:cell division protein FtsQ
VAGLPRSSRAAGRAEPAEGRQGAGAQSVATATDKRFRRAHVKPSRKRTPAWKSAWLAIRVFAVVMGLGYGGYRGVTSIVAAQTLQVGHLVVRGNQRLSTGEVLALVDGLRGQNILTIRIGDWQQRLLASPWVDSATIRRVLPATLEIMIHERVPMGIGRVATSLYLIDAKGVIVDEYGPAYADIDLPIIDGLATAPQAGGALIDAARTEFAGRVIGALSARPELARRVSQIDVTDLHDAVVILDDDTALLRLGDADFVARLQQYLDLQPALRERLASIDSVDLRFDERLYVRPVKALPAQARR